VPSHFKTQSNRSHSTALQTRKKKVCVNHNGTFVPEVSLPTLFCVSQEIYIDDPQPQLMHLFRIQNRLHLSLSIFRRNGYRNYNYEICMLIKQSNTVSITLGDKTRGVLRTVIFIIDVSTRRIRRSKFIARSGTTAGPIILLKNGTALQQGSILKLCIPLSSVFCLALSYSSISSCKWYGFGGKGD